MTADFLNDMQNVFGKPKAIHVESNGETILSNGVFDKEKRFFDGKLRPYR